MNQSKWILEIKKATKKLKGSLVVKLLAEIWYNSRSL